MAAKGKSVRHLPNIRPPEHRGLLERLSSRVRKTNVAKEGSENTYGRPGGRPYLCSAVKLDQSLAEAARTTRATRTVAEAAVAIAAEATAEAAAAGTVAIAAAEAAATRALAEAARARAATETAAAARTIA